MCRPGPPLSINRMNHIPMQDEARTDHRVLPRVWRIGLITVGTLLIWVGGIQFSTFLFGAEMSLQKHITNAVGIGVLAVLLVLVFRRYVDRRPVSTLGLHGGKQAARDFCTAH